MNETTITTIPMGINANVTASALHNGVLASYKNEGEVNELSDIQQLILYVFTIISGLLSINGSSLIMYNLLTEKKKPRRKSRASNSLKRILIGLCCSDIVMSLCWVMQQFLVPRETSSRLFAIGNQQSCTAIGFIQQLAMSTMFYNASLSIYYLCRIRLSMKETMFAKRVEPVLHTVSILFPLVTATFGAIFQLYNETPLSALCYYENNPRCISDDDNINNDEQQEYIYNNNNTNDIVEWLDSSNIQCREEVTQSIAGGIPFVLILFTIIGNNVSIFIFVKRTINRSSRHGSSTHLGNTRSSKETERIRQVATQSFLYVTTFLISYIWTFSTSTLEGQKYDNRADFYILLILMSIFTPLQGFNNAFVYFRPTYLRYRKKYKVSVMKAIKTTIFGEDDDLTMPRSSAQRNAESIASNAS